MNAPFTDELKTSYSDLIALYKALHTEPLNSEHIKGTQRLVKQQLALAKSDANAYFGQLHLPKAKLPFRINLAFNAAALVILLGQRQRYSELALAQLCAATLTLYSHCQAPLEQLYAGKSKQVTALRKPNKSLQQATQKAGLEIWAQGLSVAQHLHVSDSAQQTYLASAAEHTRLLWLAMWLALKLTPAPINHKQSFAHCLQAIALKLPTICLGLLEPLIAYPSVCPPGALVKVQKLGWLWCIAPQENGFLGIAVKDTAEAVHFSAADILQVAPPRAVNGFATVTQLWFPNNQQREASNGFMQAAQPSFRLDKPPANLLAVQDQLNRPEPDIDRLCRLIEREPAFCRSMQQSASANARLPIDIKNVRHALMMNGLYRTNSILVKQALQLRLTQNPFPLREWLHQYAQCVETIAAQIARRSNKLLAEEAAAFATFACTGFFTLAEFKQQLLSTPGKLAPMLMPEQHPELIPQALTVARAWLQDAALIQGLQGLNKPVTKGRLASYIAQVLQLAFILSQKVFFAAPIQKLRETSDALGLSNTDIEQIINDSINDLHCPLIARG